MRFVFRRDVILRILSVSDGMAISDKPIVDLNPRNAACRERSPVSVPACNSANDGPTIDQLIKCQRGQPATRIALASPKTYLIAFWGINAIQSNPLPVNLDRIGVDNRSDAGKIRLLSVGRHGYRHQEQRNEEG